MWMKWLPWRFVLSRIARSRGFIDPIALLSRVHQFAQPSEVTEPIELLRAGVFFHGRGLINARAIQHNLDWVWPMWVERQFDPQDKAFVPRAFSITHVNLTHRNWTAVGQPGLDWFPLVDPHGLLTPLADGWSLDGWFIPDEGPALLPSRCRDVHQELGLDEPLTIRTQAAANGDHLTSRAWLDGTGDEPVGRWEVETQSPRAGWLVIAPRPANMEGVSFIHRFRLHPDRQGLSINEEGEIRLDRAPDATRMSHYHDGDVYQKLHHADGARLAAQDRDVNDATRIECKVGMATAALLYRTEANQPCRVGVSVPYVQERLFALSTTRTRTHQMAAHEPQPWGEVLDGVATLDVPDDRTRFLYDAAIRTLILHSPGEVYPGPYTYRRFWFRDACLILNAMLAAGMVQRSERVLKGFPARQKATGYFRSQEGEWDSNGQVLWIFERFAQLTGKTLLAGYRKAMIDGARWIRWKRTKPTGRDPHAGLLPAGFSAEHLGPNDYYYWDDFWSIAGLQSVARILRDYGEPERAMDFQREAEDLAQAVERSLARTAAKRDRPGLPASPYRRMDSGAVGSLAVGYPLSLWPADDERLLATADFLHANCLVHNGFFQDMIHSGVNAYLTLHLAQVFLRAGDERFWPLVEAVADLASPTGQWPEAIHPATGGGCMGDGQHVWAAAEWVMMIRNMFVREEGDRLIFASGVPAEWLRQDRPVRFGPTLTPHGPVTIVVTPDEEGMEVRWEGRWREGPPCIEVRPPGAASATVTEPTPHIHVRWSASTQREREKRLCESS